MLALLCRVAQLEQNAGMVSSQLQTVQGQLAAKEADNISLVEKIRYLQRYTRQARSGNKQLQLMQVDAAGVPQPTVGIHMCVPVLCVSWSAYSYGGLPFTNM